MYMDYTSEMCTTSGLNMQLSEINLRDDIWYTEKTLHWILTKHSVGHFYNLTFPFDYNNAPHINQSIFGIALELIIWTPAIFWSLLYL